MGLFSFELTSEFIESYKGKKAPFGYKDAAGNSVGEITFLRTYSRLKPDGTKEDLGIIVLDEPALNNEDKTVLELKYVQSKNVVRATPMDVDSIEQADKKPKEI